MCRTWHTYVYDMTHSYVWHDSFIRVTWLICTCDMTLSYVCVHMRRTWHIQMCVQMCRIWHIHVCDMTPSYVWHDSFICVTWLLHVCDITFSYLLANVQDVANPYVCANVQDVTHPYVWQSYVWPDSFICVTWLIYVRDMTHSYVRHDSFVCVIWLCYIYIYMCTCVGHDTSICVCKCVHIHTQMPYKYVFMRVTWLNHMCDMTESYVCVQMCSTWSIHTHKHTHTHTHLHTHTNAL